MRGTYPSDISREQFSVIEYELQSARKALRAYLRPVRHFLRDYVCSQRKQACDFSKWNIVCHYFQMWSAAGNHGEASLLDRVLRELVLSERVIHGREPKTSMIITDSKSVKNTDTACEKGYDAGKKLQA